MGKSFIRFTLHLVFLMKTTVQTKKIIYRVSKKDAENIHEIQSIPTFKYILYSQNRLQHSKSKIQITRADQAEINCFKCAKECVCTYLSSAQICVLPVFFGSNKSIGKELPNRTSVQCVRKVRNSINYCATSEACIH